MNADLSFVLFIVVGFYAIAGAIFNWDWFMRDPKANVFVHLLGRTGTRALYVILGISLIFIGAWGLFVLPE
jgi:hypothetical protein